MAIATLAQQQPLAVLDIRHPTPFFQQALARQTPVSIFFYAVLGFFLGGYLAVLFTAGGTGFWLYMGTLATIPAVLVLLPVHELLHALAYYLAGARDIRFGITRKNLMVYAAAHGFVATTRQFIWVAVLPFLVITTALVTWGLLMPEAKLFTYGTLMLHTLGCMGDMALLNFYYLHRQRGLVTYDDLDAQQSYFYATR